MQKHVQAAIAALEDAERGPSDKELHDAPELNPWHIEHQGKDKRMEIHLYGGVRGHPEIDDPCLTTSPVVEIDPEHGWARTPLAVVPAWARLAVPISDSPRSG